jgi:hypothetical protein
MSRVKVDGPAQKTILLPSGEKSGKIAVTLMCVTCCLSVPFCFIVQTWTGPPPCPEQ